MNKSEIIKKYNVVKILTAKDLAILSKTYNDNLEEIIVQMIRKTNKPDVLQQILDKLTIIDTRLTKVESLQAKDHKLLLDVNVRLNNVENRLTNVIKLNNLKE